MALTSTSRFDDEYGVRIRYSLGVGEPTLDGLSWTLSDGSYGHIPNLGSNGRPPVSGEEGYVDLGILQTIFASSVGFRNADGDSIAVTLHSFPYGTTIESLEAHGHYNPLDADSYDNYRDSLARTRGAFLRHASVADDDVSGRSDISMAGGIKPVKAVPPTGDLDQSIADWFAETLGSNARFGLNSLPGQEFDNGSTGVAGTEVEGDVRVGAMIVYLESIRSAGTALYDDDNPLSDITEWSVSIFIDRTFSMTLNTLGDQLIFTIPSTTSGAERVTYRIQRAPGSDAVIIDDINRIINDATVTFPTENEDDVPPFGSTAIPVLMERAVMAGGEVLIDRGIPALWTPTRRKPIGARDILTWDDLEVVAGQSYRKLSFGHFNFAVHVVSSANRVIRIPDPWDIVPYVGGVVQFEVHNNNSYVDGKTVEIQNAGGENKITLLGQEVVPLELEWFKDGTGELRSPRRVARNFEVAGDDLGDFDDVGFWNRNSSSYARPVLFPTTTRQTQSLRYNAEAFERGTASIVNGTLFTSSAFDLHVPEAIKLLKRGRFQYDLHVVVVADSGA